jgi:hypothetical protein
MRTLKDAMKEMIEDGYVFKRPNRDPRYKALEYRLNLPKFRKELVALPAKPDKNDSAILHDDSADLHHDSADLHDDDAKLHDASANLHPKRNIDLTDIHNIDSTERKNGTPSKTSKGTSKPEATHSSIHASSSHSQSFSSQETKPEEVTLSEDEQRIYDYGCQTIFKAKPPLRTAKLQSECAEIAKHVKTVEQFTSLVQFVRALPYIQGQVHLKNLVNELNGWLQIQSQLPPAPEELPPVTDDEIAEKVSGFCRIYKDDNVEEHIQKVIQIQQQVGMDNNEMYDLLFEAKEETTYSGVRDMQSFFRQISRILKQKHKILI